MGGISFFFVLSRFISFYLVLNLKTKALGNRWHAQSPISDFCRLRPEKAYGKFWGAPESRAAALLWLFFVFPDKTGGYFYV